MIVPHSQVRSIDPSLHAVSPHPFPRSATSSISTPTAFEGPSFHVPNDTPFVAYQAEFLDIIGDRPSLHVVAEKDWPWAHEAGIYLPYRQSIFVTSNRLQDAFTAEAKIVISEVRLSSHGMEDTIVIHHKEDSHGIRMANGGINYGEEGGMLFCDQGYQDRPSALVHVTIGKDGTFVSNCILNNFHGRAFNSLNDVVIHPNGTIWFTDPDYGFEQSFKPKPELPCQVYCFDPQRSDIRVVAQGIPKCNGISFSPDFKTCYITDTSYVSGKGELDPTKGGWIYAYDVAHYGQDTGQPAVLANKRVFAFTDSGAPDGIKCDTNGNVYAGCFDGVHIWSPQGTLLGKIILPYGDGCANLVFGPPGHLYIMAEHRLYGVKLAASGVLASHGHKAKSQYQR